MTTPLTPEEFKNEITIWIKNVDKWGGSAGVLGLEPESAVNRIITLAERYRLEGIETELRKQLEKIVHFENRTPEPGEVTSESFGRAGAGMEREGRKQYLRDRIAELEKKREEL